MQDKPKSGATRDGYGDALVEIGKDERVVVLDADLSESTRSKKFKEKYPERFINVGVAEQNLMGISAGLAATGKIPFASTFAMFAMRGYEQIRNSICYSELNVKICGSHGGLATGEDGATHQCLEDFSLMRTIPNMVVLSPADVVEAKKCVHAAYEHKGPVYIRTTRAKTPILFDENYKFQIGKGVIIREGKDITLIATGPMVSECIKAAEILAADKKKVSARVVNISTIKPIDEKLILKCAKETKAIISCEDHFIVGGLGSAVAEVLAENKCPTTFERIAVKSFGESGKPEELYEKYGLSAKHIVKAAKKLIKS
ncbi:MAG: transketolase family protein [Nanoarchaeota archaeon]|nr:transketolase family protein [Nanoarchaeota archaeon]